MKTNGLPIGGLMQWKILNWEKLVISVVGLFEAISRVSVFLKLEISFLRFTVWKIQFTKLKLTIPRLAH